MALGSAGARPARPLPPPPGLQASSLPSDDTLHGIQRAAAACLRRKEPVSFVQSASADYRVDFRLAFRGHLAAPWAALGRDERCSPSTPATPATPASSFGKTRRSLWRSGAAPSPPMATVHAPRPRRPPSHGPACHAGWQHAGRLTTGPHPRIPSSRRQPSGRRGRWRFEKHFHASRTGLITDAVTILSRDFSLTPAEQGHAVSQSCRPPEGLNSTRFEQPSPCTGR